MNDRNVVTSLKIRLLILLLKLSAKQTTSQAICGYNKDLQWFAKYFIFFSHINRLISTEKRSSWLTKSYYIIVANVCVLYIST